jgi:hypothetical protein
MDDVELGARNMGVKRWRTRASDRTEWSSVVREAKAKLKGMQCYRKEEEEEEETNYVVFSIERTSGSHCQVVN